MTQATTERRAFALSDLKIENRADDDSAATITGYAAVFDKLSEDLGGFREKIAPGAFKRTLKEGADVRALVDHDPSRIIGRTTAGTLDLEEDDKGLRVSITPPDTSVGRDITESIKRGDVDQMSFGFITVTDEWRTIDGEEIRELQDVDLFDVSPVTFPAYPDTSVAARSLEQRNLANKPAPRTRLARARVRNMSREL